MGRVLWVVVLAVAFQSAAWAEKGVDFRVAVSLRGLDWIDPGTARSAAEPLISKIAKQLKVTYSLEMASSSEAVFNGIKRGKVDVALLPPGEYSRLGHSAKVIPVVRAKAFGKKMYRLVTLVRRGSGIKSFSDLKGKSIGIHGGTKISQIYLDVQLAKLGVTDAQRYFSSTKGKRKVQSAVIDVLLGESDACVTPDAILEAMAELNPQVKRNLVPIHKSEPLPFPPFFVRKDLPAKKVKLIRDAMTGLTRSTEGRQLLLIFRLTELLPAKPSDYAAYQELLRKHAALKKQR